ncbi:MAG: hypothetical protein ACLTQI_01315 [Slackia sp.]
MARTFHSSLVNLGRFLRRCAAEVIEHAPHLFELLGEFGLDIASAFALHLRSLGDGNGVITATLCV